MLHAPSGRLRNAQVLCELDARNTLQCSSHQVNSKKPFLQEYSRMLHYRARADTKPAFAGRAIPTFILHSAFDLPDLHASTTRTSWFIAPSLFSNVLPTRFLIWKLLVELWDTKMLTHLYNYQRFLFSVYLIVPKKFQKLAYISTIKYIVPYFLDFVRV